MPKGICGHGAAMRRSILLSAVACLLFCVACGPKGGARTPAGTGMGNFSKASLNGFYVYQIAGVDFSSGTGGVQYWEAGIFQANGAGNITSGVDDFCEGGSCQSNPSVTGSYTIGHDGTGSIQLSGVFGTISLSVTLVSSNKVYLVEADATLSAAGVAEVQSSAASTASSPPSGTFTFRMHTTSSTQFASMVGVLTVSGGTVSGSDDVLRGTTFDNGTNAPLTLNGVFNAPTNGRGTGSITDSSLVTTPFIYYLVDGNNSRFLSSESGILGLGRAEMQSGGPFSAASLSGGYAFGSRGDDSSVGPGAVNTVGNFTAGGTATISAGAYDSVQDGTSLVNVPFTGSYSMTVNGRVAVTLNPSRVSAIQQVFWMVSPARAFFVTNDSTKVEDGTLDLQVGGPFSNASLKGQYAFVMDGVSLSASVLVDRVGWIQWNGNGGLTWNEFFNSGGATQQPGFLSGTYTASGNGRVAASVNSLSNNIIGYLVSESNAYILQNDQNVEISGQMNVQP